MKLIYLCLIIIIHSWWVLPSSHEQTSSNRIKHGPIRSMGTHGGISTHFMWLEIPEKSLQLLSLCVHSYIHTVYCWNGDTTGENIASARAEFHNTSEVKTICADIEMCFVLLNLSDGVDRVFVDRNEDTHFYTVCLWKEEEKHILHI